jgi:hypothetical protein
MVASDRVVCAVRSPAAALNAGASNISGELDPLASATSTQMGIVTYNTDGSGGEGHFVDAPFIIFVL